MVVLFTRLQLRVCSLCHCDITATSSHHHSLTTKRSTGNTNLLFQYSSYTCNDITTSKLRITQMKFLFVSKFATKKETRGGKNNRRSSNHHHPPLYCLMAHMSLMMLLMMMWLAMRTRLIAGRGTM